MNNIMISLQMQVNIILYYIYVLYQYYIDVYNIRNTYVFALECRTYT